MCEPTTLMVASLALSAATAGISYDNSRKTAKDQADAIKRGDELNMMDTARQQSQQAAQGAEAMSQAARRAQAEMASLDTIAGEYGGGVSADRSRSTLGVQQGEELATISSNARSGLNESSAGAYASRSRANSQLRSIQGPSLAMTALQIGQAGLSTWDRYEAASTPKAPATSKTKAVK